MYEYLQNVDRRGRFISLAKGRVHDRKCMYILEEVELVGIAEDDECRIPGFGIIPHLPIHVIIDTLFDMISVVVMPIVERALDSSTLYRLLSDLS